MPGADLAARRERVPPARLLVAVDQHRLGCLEEEQAVLDPAVVELVEDPEHRLEVLAAARVAHDRGVLDLAALVAEQVGELPDHLGRQVVDAEVAGVLEAGHRLRLPRAGEAGDDHEVVDRAGGASPSAARPRLRRESPRWPLRALSGLVDMAMSPTSTLAGASAAN